MRRLTSVLIFERTRSRFSEALISSPISARVARTLSGSSWVSLVSTLAMRFSLLLPGPPVYQQAKEVPVPGVAKRAASAARAMRPKRSSAMDGLRVGPDVSGQFQDADIAQVAIALRIIQAIAHHEFVGNLKTDVVRPDLLHAPARFAQQRGHAQRTRLALRNHALQVIDRAAGIQDIFHQNRVQALDAVIQILGQPHLARTARGLAVTRHGDEIERDFQTNLADQVGKKDRGALENADQM